MRRSENYAYQGDLHEVLHNPVALLGGVVGTALVTGLLSVLVMSPPETPTPIRTTTTMRSRSTSSPGPW